MTDEEKQAIEYFENKLQELKEEIKETQNDEFKGYGTLEDIAKLKYCNLHTMLNLIEKQQRQLEIKDKYLELMWFLGADYDGWDTVDGLKSLIDSLMDYVKKAGNNDDKYAVYQGGNGKYFNILYEEVKVETDEGQNDKDTETMLDTEKMDIQE